MRNGDEHQHASYYGYGKKLEPAGKPKPSLNRSEVKSSTPESGQCQNCGTKLPANAPEGAGCADCGHAFTTSRSTDD
jgi:hypothetical protein